MNQITISVEGESLLAELNDSETAQKDIRSFADWRDGKYLGRRNLFWYPRFCWPGIGCPGGGWSRDPGLLASRQCALHFFWAHTGQHRWKTKGVQPGQYCRACRRWYWTAQNRIKRFNNSHCPVDRCQLRSIHVLFRLKPDFFSIVENPGLWGSCHRLWLNDTVRINIVFDNYYYIIRESKIIFRRDIINGISNNNKGTGGCSCGIKKKIWNHHRCKGGLDRYRICSIANPTAERPCGIFAWLLWWREAYQEPAERQKGG